MEKRAILAFVLSLAALIFWQKFFMPPPQQPASQPETVQATPVPEATVPAESREVVDSEPADAFITSIESQTEPTPEPVEREIVVHSARYEAVISTKGARLVSWKLHGLNGNPDELIQMLDPVQSKFMPGDILIGEDDSYRNLVFQADVDSGRVEVTPEIIKTKITFTGLAANGLEVRKVYQFFPDRNLFTLDLSLSNTGSNQIQGMLALMLPDIIEPGSNGAKGVSSYMKTGPVFHLNGKLEYPKISKMPERWVYPEPASWAAIQGSYFFAAIVPYVGFGKAMLEPVKMDEKNQHPIASSPGLLSGSGLLLPSDRLTASYFVYIGPQNYQELKDLNIGIEKIVNFGWIEWLGKAFYYVLIHTTTYVKNYGLSIIILTIAIKILLLPLSQISMKSMRKMQEIQPLVKEVQARLKKDPRKMQEELSKLYRKHGVNPMSGCLPLLIQFPVFIALYQVLLNSIEMRGASFLWAKDLSQPDIPLVLIMGVSMVVQQKMTPTMGDPRQARMMMFMPVIFTAMFWNFPSGLVLYWLVNNLLTIVQQYFMNPSRKPAGEDESLKLKSRTLKKLASKPVDGDKGESVKE